MTLAELSLQILKGLHQIHESGFVHRDIKPENIFLAKHPKKDREDVKILDFGIAKRADQKSDPLLSVVGQIYGTPQYLAPEQAVNPDVDHRADLYSLGVMLYEFMTGVVPFQDAAPVQVLTAHVFTEPKPPSQVAPNRVKPTMEKIILKAMAKETDARFQTAMEMFEALVAREQEIVREQGLTGRAAYVPGMELTGMYTALDISKAKAAAADSDSEDPTQAMTGPPQAAIEDARRRAGANPTMNNGSSSPATTAMQSDESSTRTIIYVLIAVTAVVFLTLVFVIGYLLFLQ
jgi:serine/threonine-protein kinase